MPKIKLTAASAFVKGEYGRVSADEFRERVLEREAREAADNRSPAEIHLGDPPANRSALAARHTTKPPVTGQ